MIHDAVRATLLAAAASSLLAAGSPAFAFSQITDENRPTPAREGIVSVPLPPVEAPPAAQTPPASEPTAPAQATPPATSGESDAADPDVASPPVAEDVPPARVEYGEEKLPQPVRDLRRKLIEIARSGDLERLRPFLQSGGDATVVSAVETDGNPIDTLREASGDGEGVEMLAILLETLEAGYVHLDAGGDNEIFVWPYFTQVDLTQLTKTQLVELFELVTAGDYQRMVGNGSYDFYRVGLSPEGRFEFFVAGD